MVLSFIERDCSLSAGLLRQATYTTTRLGVYNSVSERMVARQNGAPLAFHYKLGIGMFAGGVGSMVGVPAEIALIRMSTDGRLPVDKRRGYKNAFDALARISREEGVLTLWRGATPTVIRACVLNATQLASYSQAKEMLQSYFKLRDGIPLHTGASLISGLLSTIVSMPIDIAKTRLQNMHGNEYSGVIDVRSMVCFRVVRSGGGGGGRGERGGVTRNRQREGGGVILKVLC